MSRYERKPGREGSSKKKEGYVVGDTFLDHVLEITWCIVRTNHVFPQIARGLNFGELAGGPFDFRTWRMMRKK